MPPLQAVCHDRRLGTELAPPSNAPDDTLRDHRLGEGLLRGQLADGTLHLRSDSSAGLVWRQLGFDPSREPLLTWRWKVSRTFGASSPLSPELDNFPARVLVGFDAPWDGANPAALAWRRKVEQYTGVTPPARAICYTFGGELPSANTVWPRQFLISRSYSTMD
jgi:hypothetical protein